MARITMVEPSQAEGKVKALLKAIEAEMGKVPNIAKAMATAPALLEGFMNLKAALGGGVLAPELSERIALLTAEVNNCGYCLAAHTVLAFSKGLSEEDILDSRRGSSPDAKAHAALRFARAVIDQRGQVTDDDVQEAVDAGYSEAEIAEMVGCVAFNILTNYFNNVAQLPVDFPEAKPLS